MANNTAQPFRFTGEQQDPDVNRQLYYLRARFYDPANGRFMSRDPLPGFLGKPQTLNAYAYATNNPVMFRDPSGLCSLCDWVGDHRESISTGVQLADLVPLGQIPLINIPLTIPSVILDVTAFGFLEYDILTSSCSSQRKRELTADNVANLTTGASAQALSVIASPTIAGSWAISTGGSAIEGLIYLSTSEALQNVERRRAEVSNRWADMLLPGEEIIVEAEASCKVGLLRQSFGGHVCLTRQRLLWRSRSRWLSSLPFLSVPAALVIPLASVVDMRLHREFAWAWLSMTDSQNRTYGFRVGKGPFPLLRDHARITQQWYEAIQMARGELLTASPAGG